MKINSGPVSDNAGNTNAGIDSAAFKIDMTNPTINGSASPAANANGWNNTDAWWTTHAPMRRPGSLLADLTKPCPRRRQPEQHG